MKNNALLWFRVVILFLLLLLPNIFVVFYSIDLQGNLVKIIMYLLLSVSLWSCLLVFFSVRSFFIVGFIFFLLSPVEIVVTRLTGTPISVGFMDAVFSTNYQEAKEQFTMQSWLYPYFVVAVLVYMYFLIRLPSKTFLSATHRIGLLGIFIFLNVLLYGQMVKINLNENKSKKLILGSALWSWQKKYFKIYPTNVLLSLYSSLEGRYQSFEKNEVLKDFYFRAVKATSEEEVVVLVLGESARYGQFGINGYHRNTTPFLNLEKDLISYSNVYSEGVLTSISVPLILTRATAETKELQNREKTLPELFQEAGFSSYIISTQGAFIPMIKRIENKVDDATFFGMEGNVLDEAILPHFEKILGTSNQSKFILIHTMGSHMAYEYRYSDHFSRFAPTRSKNEIQTFQLGLDRKQELINAYDNSILYTDWLLSQLISSLKKKNIRASLLYVSDHGENIYDDGRTLGHGVEHPVKRDVHIPFLLWVSPQFRNQNPTLYRNLINNKFQKATTEAVFYTLIDIAGVKIDSRYYMSDKSLATDKYASPKSRRALNTHKEVVEINE